MVENSGTAAMFWEWHYLIFILPFAIGALLLILSTLRFGGHGHAGVGHHTGVGHHMGGGHGGGGFVGRLGHLNHGAGIAHPAGHGHPQGAAAGSHQAPAGSRSGAMPAAAPGVTPLTLAMLLLGVGRAPLPMVIEFFLVCWGVAGFWSVSNLVHAPHPNLLQMIPSLAIALGSGVVGSRLAAEVIGRIMPRDESSVVSGDALYGLTGKVAYPVTNTGGRVHIYDEFGTLHDESCRVAEGHPEIAKGSTVIITDRDAASGRLIVELSPVPLKHSA